MQFFRILERCCIFVLTLSFLFQPVAPLFAAETASDIPPSLVEADLTTLESGEASSSAVEEVPSTWDTVSSDIDKEDPTEIPDDAESVLSPITTPSTYTPVSSGLHTDQKSPLRIDETSGALSFSYALSLPEGRAGMTPSVSFAYNSQNTSLQNTVGYGWSISIPSITRVNKHGVEDLYTSFDFVSSLDGELVADPDAPNHFRARNDVGDFRDYVFEGNTWTVSDKQGTVMHFTAPGAQMDPTDSTRVFSWNVVEIENASGQEGILFSYWKYQGFVYPSSIQYTTARASDRGAPWDAPFLVQFLYESRPALDQIPSFAPGFSVVNSSRLAQVTISSTHPTTTLLRSYTFSYTLGQNGARSLLSSITESARDEVTGTLLTRPPTEFTYANPTAGWTFSSSSSLWSEPPRHVPPPLQDAMHKQLLDVNGDALPDILRAFDERSNPTHAAVYTPEELEDLSVALQTENHTWVDGPSFFVPIPMMVYQSLFSSFDCTVSSSTTLPACSGGEGTWGQGVEFADVNGDYLPDILKNRSEEHASPYAPAIGPRPNTAQAWVNSGSGWVENVAWAPTIPLMDTWHQGSAARPGYLEWDSGTDIVDVNGDGLPDLLRRHSPSNNAVQLNNGFGFDVPLSTWNAFTTFAPFSYPRDVNGDGLPDGMEGELPTIPEGARARLNTGNPAAPLSSVAIDAPAGTRFQGPSHTLLDVNGDGLLDIVCDAYFATPSNPTCATYLGTGVQWVRHPEWNIPVNLHSNYGNPLVEVSVADLNADGLLDFKLASANAYLHSAQTPPDLLMQVVSPQGSRTTATYAASGILENASGHRANPDLPFSVTVVASLLEDDGFGHASTTTYSYEGGFFSFTSAFDKRFAGFHSLAREDDFGNTTTTFFHQGNETDVSLGEFEDHPSKIGKPFRVEVRDASGNLFTTIVNRWERDDRGGEASFVKLASTVELSFDGDADHRDRAQAWTYDVETGNVLSHIEYGEVQAEENGVFVDISQDQRVTSVTYATPTDSMSHVLGSVATEEVEDFFGNRVSFSRTQYDDLPLGSVSVGHKTSEDRWISGDLFATTSWTFHPACSLVTSEMDPLGRVTLFQYSTDASSSFYCTHPLSVTNPLGQTTSFIYDLSSGQPTTVTLPTGHQMQTVYDAFDRPVQEFVPAPSFIGPAPSPLVLKTSSVYNDASLGVSVAKTEHFFGTQSRTTTTHLDGLGRVIQEKVAHSDGVSFRTIDTNYDALGRSASISLPYLTSVATRTPATVNSALLTTIAYDVLNRPVSSADILGVTTNIYDEWTTTATDALGNPKEYEHDAFDRLVSVVEHNGLEAYTTSYVWDASDHLTRITDALGNIRHFTYDGRGLRLSAEDLHAPGDSTFGIWGFAYDLSGNLLTSLSSNGITTTSTYDALHRVLSEDASSSPALEVSYTYDLCPNGVGKLCEATTLEGTVSSYAYDPVGNVRSETKIIPSESETPSFTTNSTHDFQGQVLLTTYPDGTQVQNIYNAVGSLQAIQKKAPSETIFTPVVTSLTYGPHGQVTEQINGNGTVTTNTYDEDARYRLMGKTTTGGFITPEPVTVSFSSTPGDGTVYRRHATWDGAHDAVTGSAADMSSFGAHVRVGQNSAGTFQINRLFLPFDTSSLPDGSEILSATLKVYVQGKDNRDNDGDDFVTVTHASQSSPATLTTEDYDQAGSIDVPQEGISVAERKDITTTPINAYLSFPLNEIGISWISTTAPTLLALREGHDVLDHAFVPKPPPAVYPQYNSFQIHMSENPDTPTSKDPILEVTYIPPAVPVETIQSLVYSYDANGNITQIVDASDTQTAKTTIYAYDDLNRLASATVEDAVDDNNGIITYTYNPLGNLLSRSDLGTYVYEGNTIPGSYANPHAPTSLLTTEGKPFSLFYDNNGNLLTDGTTTHVWDYKNRITSSTVGTDTTSFIYDHTLERISKTTGDTTTLYLGNNYSVNEVTSMVPSGTSSTVHVSTGSSLVGTMENLSSGSTLRIIHTDHLGSTNVVTDSSATLVELLDYNPYGSERLHSGTIQEERTYIGEYVDTETNLSYLNARYYDSERGQFLSEDSVHLAVGDDRFEQEAGRSLELHLMNPQALNSYSYANNNPVTYSDPSGKIAPLVLLGVLWAAAELGLTTYDGYNTINTISNPNATTAEKSIVVGGFVAGLVGPGGGYGTVGKQLAKQADNGGQILYRSMKEGLDGMPIVGRQSARELGARAGQDIPVHKGGLVYPDTGGMSVSPGGPEKLSFRARPQEFGGAGKDPVWCLNSCLLPKGLRFVQDSLTHGTIQPEVSMLFDQFNSLIESTKSVWKKL